MEHNHHNHETHPDHKNHHDHGGENSKYTWAYLIISLVLTCMVSLVGAFVPKKLVQKYNRYFIALCVGTLCSTIFVELLPHAVSDVIEMEKKGSKTGVKLFSWLIFTGIMLTFLIETFVHLSSGGHAHGHQGCGDECTEISKSPTEILEARKNALDAAGNKESKESKSKIVKSKIKSFLSLPSVALTDIIAKACHRLVDGAIIGSLYSVSPSSGLGGTLSIAVHEVSVNLGAYSLFISSGIKKKKSIFLCAISTFPIIIGGIITFVFEKKLDETNALSYINFLSIGMFLYLTLADMLPLLMHEEHSTHEKKPVEIKNNVQKKTSKKKFIEWSSLLLCFCLGFFITFTILYLTGHKH